MLLEGECRCRWSRRDRGVVSGLPIDTQFAILRVSYQVHDEAIQVFHKSFTLHLEAIEYADPRAMIEKRHLEALRKVAVPIKAFSLLPD